MNNDNIRIAAASLVGALIGGVAGYLLMTERGREARRHIQPAIEDLRHELASFAQSLEGAGNVARDGWRFLQDIVADDRTRAPGTSVTH